MRIQGDKTCKGLWTVVVHSVNIIYISVISVIIIEEQFSPTVLIMAWKVHWWRWVLTLVLQDGIDRQMEIRSIFQVGSYREGGRRMCLILQPCFLHWGWFLCFLAPCFFSSLENDENHLLPWQHNAVVNSGSFVLYSEVTFCRGHLSKDFSFCSCHCLSHFH